jgi:glutathione S-transferase
MANERQKTTIDLYTALTPNGQKANILLEELHLTYTTHPIDLSKNEQKSASFLKINPNGRIPAMVDHRTSQTPNTPKRIFESGAMLLYLTAKYDSRDHEVSFPYDSDDYWECLGWVMWMQGGLGPMQGQANHFYRYAPEKIQYGIDRYQTETKRLYQVLEDRLAEQESGGQGLWLVGGRYSIADLNCFCWVNWAEWAGVSLENFPKLREWLKTINERPAVQRGLNIPEKFEMKEKLRTEEGEQEYAKYHSNWVMQGMKDDQEKQK